MVVFTAKPVVRWIPKLTEALSRNREYPVEAPMSKAEMLGMSAAERKRLKLVAIVVGMVKLTVSEASVVLPATAEYGVVLVASRREIRKEALPAVMLEVLRPIWSQSME